MNAGQLGDITLIVSCILITFAWGSGLLSEVRVPRIGVLFLLAPAMIAEPFVIRWHGLQISVASVYLVLLSLGLMVLALQSLSDVVNAITTIAATIGILTSLSFLDAFAPFWLVSNPQTLYFAVSIVFASLFASRTIVAVVAVIVAVFLCDYIVFVYAYMGDWRQVVWGDADVRGQAVVSAFSVVWLRGILLLARDYVRMYAKKPKRVGKVSLGKQVR